MKSYFIIGLFFFSNSVFSQNTFEKTFHSDYNTYINSVLPADSSSWYVLTGDGHYFYFPLTIFKIDNNTNTIWKKRTNITSSDPSDFHSFTPTNDGNFLITNEDFQCDISLPYDIIKFSSIGDTLWNKHYSSPSGFTPTAISEFQDGSIFIGGYNWIVKLNSTGDTLWTKNLGLANLKQIESSKENLLFFNSDSGIIKIDTSGQILLKRKLTNKIQKHIPTNDSGCIVLSDFDLIKLDKNFSTTDSVNLSINYKSILSISKNDLNYFVVGKEKKSSLSRIEIFDSLLTSQSFFTFSDSFVNAVNIFTDNNKIVVSGTETNYSDNSHSNFHGFVKTFDLNGSSQNDSIDVGIINIEYDSAIAVPINVPFPGIPYQNIYLHNTKIIVKNFSNKILNTVEINFSAPSFGPCSYFCYEPNNLVFSFTNLSILPGDTAQFFIDTIIAYCYGTSLPVNFRYCIWTSSPNEKIDINHYNDGLCDSLLILGIKELNEDEKYFSIYPTLASDFIEVKSYLLLKNNFTISISNILGQKIYEKNCSVGSPVVNIDVRKFTSGLYFLSLHSPDKNLTKRFMKQ